MAFKWIFTSSRFPGILPAMFFYDSKRSIGEVLFFFNQFYWSDF